ncbi:hypothetical protein ACUJ46_11895 [Sandaracinobacteroides sp. A072]|uniref:hypothetical protein n=1 Tax=Sandaracinobacteroides sp. A072 TaxID=3461146 RepID=UPI0040428546
MGKWVADEVLDGALAVLAGADLMLALPGQPADYAGAVASQLAAAPLAAGDFSFSAGDVSGRKVAVSAKAGLSVLQEGSASHVALADSANARLLYVTTCPARQLPAGGSVNFDTWTVEIGAPL